MIIEVWGNREQPQENLDVQSSVLPATEFRRIKVEAPTLKTLVDIYKTLQAAGVPDNAKLEFSRWNVPETTWYVHASWSESD